jgi:hypothetical protein
MYISLFWFLLVLLLAVLEKINFKYDCRLLLGQDLILVLVFLFSLSVLSVRRGGKNELDKLMPPANRRFSRLNIKPQLDDFK